MTGAGAATIPKPITNTNIGGEYLTYTNPIINSTDNITQWRWIVGGVYKSAPDLMIGNLEYSETATKTRYIYPGVSLRVWRDAVKALVGTCNFDAAFDEQYEQGTLLFMGADLSEMANESAVKMWKADMKFKARYVYNRDAPTTPLGWNYIFNPVAASYQLLVDQNGDNTYAYTDFTLLTSACLPPISMGNNLPTM